MESIKTLPPQSHFFSTLSGQAVKDKDYHNVKRLWEILQLDSLYDLYEFYCTLGKKQKTSINYVVILCFFLDCYLLGEALHEFREQCFRNYRIYPDSYLSLPGFSLGDYD